MGKHDSMPSCAVCMDPLFNQLDDLDEEIPVVITECGHAYHNPCILEWCKSQEDRGLDILRDQHVDGDDEPTVDDVQVVCPTCREECYRDVTTKKMMFTRLYLNYSEDSHDASWRSMGTPVKERSNGKSEELMKLARGAKRLSQDVIEIDGDVDQARIDGIIDKGQNLCRDGGSARSIKAVQKYFLGLTNAMNMMTATLRAHPLAATLRIELEAAENRLKEAQRDLRYQRDVALPRALDKARRETRDIEEAKATKIAKQLSAALARIQAEQTQRAARSKEADEREAHLRKETESLTRQLDRAEEAKQKAFKDLQDRTRQLKEHQAKSISRKELQARIRRLEAENLELRSGLSGLQVGEGGSSTAPGKRPNRDLTPGIPASSPIGPVGRAADESLEVDLPSFIEDRSKSSIAMRSPMLPSPRPSKTRAHPTSRTYSIEADTRMSDLNDPKKRKSSKYFPDESEDDSQPEEDESGVIVAASSPAQPSNTKRSRTNPYPASKRDAEAKAKLRRVPSMDVVDLCSTDGDSPLRPADLNLPQARRSQTQVDIRTKLKLSDKNGRPAKGLATGSKTRVRH